MKAETGWTKALTAGAGIAVLSFLYLFIGYFWDFKFLTIDIVCGGMLAVLINFRAHLKEYQL